MCCRCGVGFAGVHGVGGVAGGVGVTGGVVGGVVTLDSNDGVGGNDGNGNKMVETLRPDMPWLTVALAMSSPFTPMGVPLYIEGRKALEYAEGREVRRLMNPGRFWFSVPNP